jgi:hypothetical protein
MTELPTWPDRLAALFLVAAVAVAFYLDWRGAR